LGSVARRAPARVRCIPLTGPRHLSCPSAGYVNPAPARAVWTEGSPRPVRDGGSSKGPRAPGHAEAVRMTQTAPKKARHHGSPTRALVPLQPAGQPLTQGRGPRHATGLEDGAGRSPRPPKPWAASDDPAVRCTVTAWPRECRGHRRPALRTGESGLGLAGRPGAGYGGDPAPGSSGALTLRPSTLEVSALCACFTWVQIAGTAG
jgi:hypothetical protein